MIAVVAKHWLASFCGFPKTASQGWMGSQLIIRQRIPDDIAAARPEIVAPGFSGQPLVKQLNFPQICLRLKEHTPIFVERASLFLKDLCIANRNTDMRGQDAQTLDVVRREGISTRTLDVQDTDHPVTCDKRQCQFRTGFWREFACRCD